MQLTELEDFVRLGKPPSILVDQVLPEKSLMLISGEPYTGKSLVAMDMALAVAWGGKFLGKYAARAAHVIYVGMDAPNWYSAWMAASLTRGRPVQEDRCKLWFVTRAQGIRPLDSDTAAKQLVDTADELDVELIVIDTLRKAHTHNENDPGAMTVVLDRCRLMNDAGIAVVLLHHKGKPKEGVEASKAYDTRGSSSIPGDVDIHWAMEKKGNVARVYPVKGRGVEQETAPPPFDLVIQSTGTPLDRVVQPKWELAPLEEMVEPAPAKPGRPRKPRWS